MCGLKAILFLAGSFELIKRNEGLLLVRCDRCLGLIERGLRLWYNDIYKFEESLDFFQTDLHKRIGSNKKARFLLIYHPDAGHLAGLNMIFASLHC